ncbi:hypothetical protein SAMN04488527_1352 [Aliiroseovarius crassostreae]|uniref:Uncharacterized protein n=1 Tax=Aliiroseovarius crassostreae TaxID=154981 RepID=A0A0P7JRH8_9RHOB|nr:hypothetical protein [Aliiroseovarius crassostreae]KPN64023.1 hypothetical protein AKJ29_15275 [Aliiroseovarius crassostreae]SFU91259.1 hypothetical protein SAMN04488527_1352 [Aliiroseovarius crassostreae]
MVRFSQDFLWAAGLGFLAFHLAFRAHYEFVWTDLYDMHPLLELLWAGPVLIAACYVQVVLHLWFAWWRTGAHAAHIVAAALVFGVYWTTSYPVLTAAMWRMGQFPEYRVFIFSYMSDGGWPPERWPMQQ